MLRVLRILAFVAVCRFAAAQTQNQLDASPALFTVMAAINAAGYDKDIDSTSNHPLRAAVRKLIAERKPPSLVAIRNFYETHRAATSEQELSQYISFGLSLENPPSFRFRYPENGLAPDVRRLVGFEKLLEAFYEEAGIASLWRQAQPAIDRLLAAYQPKILENVQQASIYLRNPMSGVHDRRFQIYVELLAAPNVALTRTYMDDYFLVLTPSPQPPFDTVLRSYLHYLIDPVILRNAVTLERKRPLADLAQAAPLLDESYKNDYSLLAGMCLVRAVEARLSPPAERPAMVDRAMAEGFILTAHFYESLPAYEKDERSMRFYAIDLIGSIDLEKEDKRIGRLAFASSREARRVKPVARPKPPELTGVQKDMQTADGLYDRRDLAAAKPAYRKIIETQSSNPVHAQAYYGLARIALLEKDPELAEKLFEKTLELEPEPPVKAWVYVYLARLALATQEPDYGRAVEQYKAALGVEGASEMAHAAAQKELQAANARLKQ